MCWWIYYLFQPVKSWLKACTLRELPVLCCRQCQGSIWFSSLIESTLLSSELASTSTSFSPGRSALFKSSCYEASLACDWNTELHFGDANDPTQKKKWKRGFWQFFCEKGRICRDVCSNLIVFNYTKKITVLKHQYIIVFLNRSNVQDSVCLLQTNKIYSYFLTVLRKSGKLWMFDKS